jgi:putative oxidoreductase
MATQAFPHSTLNRRLLRNLALWALQIGLALMFLKAGIPKLAGNPMMVQLFGVIGLGQWFRYLTGSLEVAGAIGLLVPGLAGYAGLVLAVVMSGAVVTHLAVLGSSPVLPLVLLVVSLLIAWGRLGGRE